MGKAQYHTADDHNKSINIRYWDYITIYFWYLESLCIRGAQISQKPRCDLKILHARWVKWNKLYTEHPQILGATV